MAIHDHWSGVQADMQQSVADVYRDGAKMLKAITLLACRKFAMRSPVDTGHFVSGWDVSRGTVGSYRPPQHAAPGRGARQRLVNQALALNYDIRLGDVWIYNLVPYGPNLEFGLYPNPPKRGSYVKGVGYVVKTVAGFSKQAPAGIMRVSLAEVVLEVQTGNARLIP